MWLKFSETLREIKCGQHCYQAYTLCWLSIVFLLIIRGVLYRASSLSL